jgi:hypothetical protein
MHFYPSLLDHYPWYKNPTRSHLKSIKKLCAQGWHVCLWLGENNVILDMVK